MVKTAFEIAAPGDSDDEYWDDEDESESESESGDEDDEEQYGADPLSSNNSNNNGNGNGHRPGTNGGGPRRNKKQKQKQKKQKKKSFRMKRMKVSTEGDYSSANLQRLLYMNMNNPRARGICYTSTVCCLIIGLAAYAIVPHGNTDGVQQQQQQPQAPTCILNDGEEPFSGFLYNIRHANATDLCRPDISPTDCKCHNPFQVELDDEKEGWHEVFANNLRTINETTTLHHQGESNQEYDLVLYGDSIIEQMNGMVFGKSVPALADQLDVTTELLTKEGGGNINALPLGIAGDEIHTLLYRLSNGEMPESLQPKVWWLMIGTNDVMKYDCGVDAVVAGVVTAAEEIVRKDERNRQKGAARVVINSLFPRVTLDADPLWEIIQTINHRLECYAETTHGVEFFNTTDLFVHHQQQQQQHSSSEGGSSSSSSSSFTVDPSLFLEDHIHLSPKGLRLWEEAIVEKTMELISHHKRYY